MRFSARLRWPIHHTFAPLANVRQVLLTLLLYLTPWRWRGGRAIERLRSGLEDRLGQHCVLFSSGREALLAVLQGLELRAGEEVLVPAFTCVVVPNAVHAAGGVPVFVDIDRSTLGIDPQRVERALTPRTRAIICQHTFGIPADVVQLRSICAERKLFLIEDCAHVLPSSAAVERGEQGGVVGHVGDAVILSFGRDKAISGVAGGAALTRHQGIAEGLRQREREATEVTLYDILRFLSYPLLYAAARPLYGLGIGKALLVLARAIGVLPPVYTPAEKHGHMPIALRRLPNTCALLVLDQIRQCDRFDVHRRHLRHHYQYQAQVWRWQVPAAALVDLPIQKFPLLVPHADRVREDLYAENINLSDGWHSAPVVPSSVAPEDAGYRGGSCPVAEEVAATVLTLPTHPTTTERQARRLCAVLGELLG